MSLTGIPLILVVVLGVAVGAAVTVLAWRREWRPRLLVRPAGILLTEALLLVAVGLIVNRSELFYSSWGDLLQQTDTPAAMPVVRAGALDDWLRSRAAGDHTFAWRPAGWDGWGLAAAPTVVVPPGYLEHPDRRYSVVVVVGDGWTGPPVGADQTVVVVARTTAATTAATLTAAIPAQLSHDLRVTARHWALVSPASAIGLAGRAAAAAGQYPAIAVVRDGPPPAGSRRPVTATPVTDVAAVPVGVTVGHSDGLAAAVAWAALQTPPPLAAAEPPVAWIPVHHHRPHRPASPAPARTGGSRVPGQPRP
ncbi:hypothetical protein Aph02nite_24430 [Actinoplanes philippinensis]|uniref:Uncharacterized protein n=1 Tax=Actinoplanes philippinensis TaxID=35752 RepID=A0A1I2G2U7_9ACTN|nr:hypothetical protein [Actinoplanes philippinensis]GIE76493.1 hypothetical protein Aph02nite_24430 [Actinoplanes philippinensis]SFF10961.1 hypothetical protein SAMN05421541_106102 [Actinoplanes philippinensis]